MTQRQIARRVVLPAEPDAVWAVIGDFHGLGDWHPHVPPSSAEHTADGGEFRVFRVGGEIVARERLVSRDDLARTYTYTIPEPMFPISGYVATLAVRPHGEGSAEVAWSAEFGTDSDEVAAQVEEVFGEGTFGAGLAALHERF